MLNANRSIAPLEMVWVFFRNSNLIIDLIKREVVGRYRGSSMGLLWSFFNPILMLIIYTFVFSIVFKARWPGGSESKTEFALVLFSGLMVFNLFSECINRAPSLILNNANYVKKVIFPLEILPIVALGAAFFHFAISLIVWLVFFFIFFGLPKPEIFLLLAVLIPLMFLIMGLSWGLASLGVYLRDVSQVVGVLTTVLMFMSPIFYPISALPEQYRALMHLNPLTFSVEQARDVMIWGKGINWSDWSLQLLVSLSISFLRICEHMFTVLDKRSPAKLSKMTNIPNWPKIRLTK